MPVISEKYLMKVMAQGVKIWVWEQRGVVSGDSDTGIKSPIGFLAQWGACFSLCLPLPLLVLSVFLTNKVKSLKKNKVRTRLQAWTLEQ